MITVDAMGDTCPIPVVKAKMAIKNMQIPGVCEIFVDNEFAVQNLTRMAGQKSYGVASEQLAEHKFRVVMTIGEGVDNNTDDVPLPEACPVPEAPAPQKNTVVVISSDKMGQGNDELGKSLMKAFIYALARQDELPKTVLFYNGGARLTCEDAPTLEDLKQMEAEGVEILTCGTCLNFYGLTDKLKVGGVTNMYSIAEKLTGASLVVKP